MASIGISLRNVPGTEAAVGWAGAHTLVVDRPDGVAGGMGLGFNGGQMLGLAVAGCLCNDLRYVAHARGISLTVIEADATVHLDGEPLRVTGMDIAVRLAAEDAAIELDELLHHAEGSVSAIVNSARSGFPVTVSRR